MNIFKTSLVFLVLGLALPAQIQKPKPGEAGKVVSGQGSEKKGTQEKGQKKPSTGKQGKQGKPEAKPGKETETTKVKVPEKTKEEIEEESNPIPTGTDPADIAAMKSAQSMIEAEKRLARLLKSGKIKGIDKVLPFEEISSWPYEDGLKGMPKTVGKLDGKTVMMTGFMLPIDEVENIKEFLLVQSLWSCCYGQPPDINGTVRVVMKGKKRIDYKFDPIKIVGTFKIKATVEDGFCVDIYQLDTDNVEVIK